MKSKQLIALFLSITVVAGLVYFAYRSKQSNQAQPTEVTETEKQNTEWQEETITEIGLTLQHPKDLVFRKEIADDNGRIRTVGFFLTKGSEQNPEYQLYGLFQQFRDGTQQDLELAKKEMDKGTIRDASIAGYSGIEGLILGPKTRYITTVLKDRKLFSVSTMPPTLDNKKMTEQIMATFSFE